MDNTHYARILNDVAALLQLKGENRYRVRAFENAAQTIARLSSEVDTHVEEQSLESLQGIGSSIASDIEQIHETGSCEVYDALLEELDAGLLEILEIQGLGPKRVQKIYEELGTTTLDQLAEQARSGALSDLSGIGPKTEETVLEEIERLSQRSGRTPLPAAWSTASSIRDRLADHEAASRVDVAGSLRRGRETIGDLDLLVATDEPEALAETFEAFPEVEEVFSSGESKASARLIDGLQVDLRFVGEDHYGAALHYFTGSKEHHVELRSRAKRDGLKISEYGVFPQDEEEPLAAATETEVFEAVGLSYIPPELREGVGEIEAAETGELPELVTEEDVLGDLHMHTTETDGSATIREMAEAARESGLSYIAITDHSEAVRVANGMTPERFEAQIAQIRRVDEELDDFSVLAGIEVDILAEGDLDMDRALLEESDWVVGSIHSQFDMPSEQTTDRLVRAIESGLLSALGHPTGRLLGGRDGYEFDFHRVVTCAVENDVALEINGSSGRLDLNADLARMAHEKGANFVLGSDAHSPRGLDEIRFALQQARRAWLTPDDVVNATAAERLADR